MGISAGPNILGKDNLSFIYDLADNNSYKGKPGTNIATGIFGQGNNDSTYYKTIYGTETEDIPGLGSNIPVTYVNILNDYPNSNVCCPAPFSYGTPVAISGSTAYTYQLIYKTTISEGANYLYRYEYNSGTYITEVGLWNSTNTENLGNGWKHAWGQFTTNASTNTIYLYTFFYNYSVWHTLKIAGICVSQGTTILRPQQFIPPASTRSATQGLLDLTSNRKSIDISSVSYSSNANITFDGTDDQMSVGNLGTIGTQYSIECVFNSSNIESYRNVYDMNYSTYNPNTGNVGPRLEQLSSQAIYWIWSGNTTNNGLYNLSTSISISANKFYHTVFTLNAGTVSTYLNGNLIDNNISSPQGYVTSFQDLKIGRGFVLDPSRYFSGQINLFRTYNKALSASEVRQNYNQLKSRFNI